MAVTTQAKGQAGSASLVQLGFKKALFFSGGFWLTRYGHLRLYLTTAERYIWFRVWSESLIFTSLSLVAYSTLEFRMNYLRLFWVEVFVDSTSCGDLPPVFWWSR